MTTTDLSSSPNAAQIEQWNGPGGAAWTALQARMDARGAGVTQDHVVGRAAADAHRDGAHGKNLGRPAGRGQNQARGGGQRLLGKWRGLYWIAANLRR